MSDFFISVLFAGAAYGLLRLALWILGRRRAALYTIEATARELVFFRALTGLMQGGLSIPAAQSILKVPAHRHCTLLWETLDFVYRRGLTATEVMTRLLPVLEERARMERRIWELRQRALVQWAIAAAVPWLVGLSFYGLTPDVAFDETTALTAVGALFFQSLGGLLAWRLASFL